MPASSPGSRSTTSAFKPARSHHLRYIRSSICAQSCDSVPPAPGWIDTIAAFVSWDPESMIFISNSSRSFRRPATPSAISASRLPSVASSASSRSTVRSSALAASSFTRVTSRDSSVRSRMTSCARRLSSQKDGCAISVSSAVSRCSLTGTSKMPPELGQATRELGHITLGITQHQATRGRARAASDAPDTPSAR